MFDAEDSNPRLRIRDDVLVGGPEVATVTKLNGLQEKRTNKKSGES